MLCLWVGLMVWKSWQVSLLFAEIFRCQGLEIISLGPFSFSRDKSSYNQYSKKREGALGSFKFNVNISTEDLFYLGTLPLPFARTPSLPVLSLSRVSPRQSTYLSVWRCLCSGKAINTPHTLFFKTSLKSFIDYCPFCSLCPNFSKVWEGEEMDTGSQSTRCYDHLLMCVDALGKFCMIFHTNVSHAKTLIVADFSLFKHSLEVVSPPWGRHSSLTQLLLRH